MCDKSDLALFSIIKPSSNQLETTPQKSMILYMNEIILDILKTIAVIVSKFP